MKRLALALLISFSSSMALAEGGLFLGLANVGYSSGTSGLSFNNTIGFEGGYTKIFDFGFEAFLRTGIGVTQRNAEYEVGSNKWQLDFIMLEVPVTVLYDFGDIIAGFAGINGNIVANTSCDFAGSDCDADEEAESFVMTFVGGLNMAYSANHVFEVYFETSMTDIISQLKLSYSAMGARYIYMFD